MYKKQIEDLRHKLRETEAQLVEERCRTTRTSPYDDSDGALDGDNAQVDNDDVSVDLYVTVWRTLMPSLQSEEESEDRPYSLSRRRTSSPDPMDLLLLQDASKARRPTFGSAWNLPSKSTRKRKHSDKDGIAAVLPIKFDSQGRVQGAVQLGIQANQ